MYLFLDIDGVLNGHSWNEEAQSNTLDKRCVWCFNQILRAKEPKVVIISAWRYMINNYAITTRGFEYLLRTHGVSAKLNIVGTTASDEQYPTRDAQIQQYLDENEIYNKFIILDDMDMGWCVAMGGHWYQPSSYHGLRRKDIQPILNLMDKYNI